jgi:hypothetical protein
MVGVVDARTVPPGNRLSHVQRASTWGPYRGAMALHLRTGYELPGSALVVRGGQAGWGDLERTVQKCWTEHQVYGITVYAADVPDVPDLLAKVPQLSRYGSIRRSSAETIKAAGFELLPTLRAPHYTVVLPAFTGDWLDLFIDTLSPVESNPTFVPKRRF